MELNREHFRAIIFLQLSTWINSTAVHRLALLRTTVYRWYVEFNRGRSSLQDEFHGGHSKSVVVPETIHVVRQLILQDRHVTYREIETTFGNLSGTSIHSILHEHLTVKKIYSRWIPQSSCRLVERNAPKIQSRCLETSL